LVKANIKIIDQAIHEAEPIVNNNIKNDKALKAMRSLREYNSAVCAPLRVGLDTYGVVLFATKAEGFYQELHKKLLSTLCSQVVIPLENAQLIEDLKREQQKILAKEEDARRKLARDLHDGPTQSIATIAMRLNFIKQLLKHNDIAKAQDEIVKVEDIAQKTTKEIRTMLFAMRPVVLETKGLVAALEGLAERLNATESFKVVVRNQGYNGNLPPEKEGVLFAIVEEAVGNAKKHARASEIKITVAIDKNIFLTEIKDNGVGFDVEKTRATYDQRSSLGMINLFERSEAIGGKCDIDSASGKGTTVHIAVPL
jgi:signal transduction histidine kinase